MNLLARNIKACGEHKCNIWNILSLDIFRKISAQYNLLFDESQKGMHFLSVTHHRALHHLRQKLSVQKRLKLFLGAFVRQLVQ